MAENINNIEGMEQNEVSEVKVLIALTKNRGGKKLLVPSMEGYTTGYKVDGVAVIEGENSVLVTLTELSAQYGGTSEDLPLDSKMREAMSPAMTEYDGQDRTDYIIGRYGFTDGAVVEAKKKGWLPSGGEMALVGRNKDAVNALLEAVGGALLTDDNYWTSQMFSNDYPWFMTMETVEFAMWKGQVNELRVRPVKSVEGYEEVTEE